jgi:hypothetical protein
MDSSGCFKIDLHYGQILKLVDCCRNQVLNKYDLIIALHSSSEIISNILLNIPVRGLDSEAISRISQRG